MQLIQKMQLYPLVRIAASMIIGILIGHAVSFPLWLPMTLLAAAIVVSFFLSRFIYWQGVGVMVVALFLGCTLITLKNTSLHTPPFSEHEHTYQAVLLSEPVQRGKVIRCDILVTTGMWEGHRVKASILRDTVDNNYQRLHVGDGITAVSVMEAPVNFTPSNFDYPLFLKSHGFTATTFIYWNNWRKAVVDLSRVSIFLRAKLSMLKFRQQLVDKIRAVGVDGQELAVAMAMTLGDKSMLTQMTRDVYAVTGSSHVLALSGMHLGIIYAIFSFLTGTRHRRMFRETVLLTAIWAYVVMVGMPASVVRAAIMITVYGVMSMIHRDHMSLNTLSLTAIIMLVANPLNLFDVGFQLSFLSVFSILIVCLVLLQSSSHALPSRRWWQGLWSMACVSLAAQLGTMPLVAYYFGRIACYGLVSSFVVIPLATIMIYMAVVLFLSLLLPFPSFSVLLSQLLVATTAILNRSLSVIASWPGACIDNVHLNGAQVLLAYVIEALVVFLVIFLWKRKKA